MKSKLDTIIKEVNHFSEADYTLDDSFWNDDSPAGIYWSVFTSSTKSISYYFGNTIEGLFLITFSFTSNFQHINADIKQKQIPTLLNYNVNTNLGKSSS